MFIQRRARFAWLPATLVGVATVSAFLFLIVNSLDMPLMYQDTDTGACVAVETPSGLRDCSKKPARYDYTFIAPGTTYKDLVLAAKEIKRK